MKSLKLAFALVLLGASFAFNLPTKPLQDNNKLMQIMMDGMKEMMNMKMTQDPDHDFAMMMKHHHQDGIKMARYETENGKSEELKAMAKKMIDDMQKDIDSLNAFLKEHDVAIRDTKFEQHMQAAMDTMMAGTKNAGLTGNVDHDFAVLMAVHHQGAIEMSKGELQHGQHARMKTMANKIIESNTKEKKQLEAWHSKNRK